MNDILKKGYAEKVPDKQLYRRDGRLWYIPHHGIYHKRKGNIRVVFDCTSTFRGTSLNSELLQGPDLTNTLLGVLLRFRQDTVAVMADIEGMFHQVKVPEEDKDFLRFLWWPNGNTDYPLSEYRMTVHISSGPFHRRVVLTSLLKGLLMIMKEKQMLKCSAPFKLIFMWLTV